MRTTFEGIYRNGHVELLESPANDKESPVLVTFIENEAEILQQSEKPNQMIRFGMFAGSGVTNEDDFKLAEWHGEDDFPSSR